MTIYVFVMMCQPSPLCSSSFFIEYNKLHKNYDKIINQNFYSVLIFITHNMYNIFQTASISQNLQHSHVRIWLFIMQMFSVEWTWSRYFRIVFWAVLVNSSYITSAISCRFKTSLSGHILHSVTLVHCIKIALASVFLRFPIPYHYMVLLKSLTLTLWNSL